MKKGLVLILSILFLFSVAMEAGADSVIIENPLKYDTFQELAESLGNYVFAIALGVLVLVVLIGAFFILTSGGSPDRWQRGRDIILYAMIGLGILLLARGLIAALRFILGVES